MPKRAKPSRKLAQWDARKAATPGDPANEIKPDEFPDDFDGPGFPPDMLPTIPDGWALCGRCYDMFPAAELRDANCAERPEHRIGALGMYHCPNCGAMILAGLPHPPMCARCIARQHPRFDE